MQELVRETGWTVGEISGKAGVSSSAVSQWLSGETQSLKIEPAVLLERFTGFSALWLAKGKGQKKVDTGSASTHVHGLARSLMGQSNHLKGELEKFLSTVRAA